MHFGVPNAVRPFAHRREHPDRPRAAGGRARRDRDPRGAPPGRSFRTHRTGGRRTAALPDRHRKARWSGRARGRARRSARRRADPPDGAALPAAGRPPDGPGVPRGVRGAPARGRPRDPGRAPVARRADHCRTSERPASGPRADGPAGGQIRSGRLRRLSLRTSCRGSARRLRRPQSRTRSAAAAPDPVHARAGAISPRRPGWWGRRSGCCCSLPPSATPPGTTHRPPAHHYRRPPRLRRRPPPPRPSPRHP